MGIGHDPAPDQVLRPRRRLACGSLRLHHQHIAVRQRVDVPRVSEIGGIGADRQAVRHRRRRAVLPADHLRPPGPPRPAPPGLRQHRVRTDLLRNVEIGHRPPSRRHSPASGNPAPGRKSASGKHAYSWLTPIPCRNTIERPSQTVKIITSTVSADRISPWGTTLVQPSRAWTKLLRIASTRTTTLPIPWAQPFRASAAGGSTRGRWRRPARPAPPKTSPTSSSQAEKFVPHQVGRPPVGDVGAESAA